MATEAISKPAIIIPAFNESQVVCDLLAQLVVGVKAGEFEVVVACNGCTDDTVSIVRNGFPEVVCIDIKTPSKTNAINMAEELSLGFPRVYIDADVVVSSESVRLLIAASLNENKPFVCAPRGVIDTSHSDRWVDSYYKAWRHTKFYIMDGFGSGVYVLNQAAREMFEVFPDVIADDGFVRKIVGTVSICSEAESMVRPPSSLSGLIAIKTRSKLGNIQLAKYGIKGESSVASKRFLVPVSLFQGFVYVAVNLWASVLAKFKARNMGAYIWQRDNSSRNSGKG